ncbi:MAG: polyamine aminopropyltransferase [Pseudomonadota bacterium]
MPTTFAETLHAGYAQSMAVADPPLADERTAFQHVQIFETEAFGRMMVLDGVVQITERDEACYSEMLAHPPLFAHGGVKRAMIVGGGDGAIAEEILKHPGVEQVDLVDIDGRVVELCKEHFAAIHKGVFDDARLNLKIADAFDHLSLAETAGRYDLIIADRPDPIGPAEVLFETRFYALMKRALAPGGLVTLQTGAPFFQPEELTEACRRLGSVFAQSGVYLTVTPSYVGGYMALAWASPDFDFAGVDAGTIAARFDAARIDTWHYSPALHAASFAPPRWLETLTRG